MEPPLSVGGVAGNYDDDGGTDGNGNNGNGNGNAISRVGAALIKKLNKKLSKIKILSEESIDMSMLSKSHSAMF